MTPHSVSELILARRAIREYRAAATRLEGKLAKVESVRTMPLTARVLREYARIARGAAIAEELDPTPQGLVA